MMNKRLLKFQMDALTNGMGMWLVMSALAAFLTYIVLKDYVSFTIGVSWIGALLISNGVRFMIMRAYKKHGDDRDIYRLKEWFAASSIFSAFIWGSASLIAMGKLPSGLDTLFTGIMLGVLVSIVVSNIADRMLSSSISILLLLPFVFKTVYEKSEYYILFILLEVLFLIFIFMLIRRFNQTLFRNFQLVLDKERLLKQVTEKFDLERQLKEEKMKSLQASKFAAIGEMAAGIGHEINNPLTIVLGYHWKLERLMKQKNADTELLEIVEKSSNACKRIADIVKSMREFSRMKGEEEMENFRLSSLVEMVKPLLDKSLKNSETQLLDMVEDCEARGLQSELAQVLYNLISNAIQAGEGQTDSKIILEGGFRDGYVYLSVSNGGDCIPEEVQQKMFQPFFTTKEVGKGTGLGLSLAKTIMESNQGEINYTYRGGQNIFTMKMISATELPVD